MGWRKSATASPARGALTCGEVVGLGGQGCRSGVPWAVGGDVLPSAPGREHAPPRLGHNKTERDTPPSPRLHRRMPGRAHCLTRPSAVPNTPNTHNGGKHGRNTRSGDALARSLPPAGGRSPHPSASRRFTGTRGSGLRHTWVCSAAPSAKHARTTPPSRRPSCTSAHIAWWVLRRPTTPGPHPCVRPAHPHPFPLTRTRAHHGPHPLTSPRPALHLCCNNGRTTVRTCHVHNTLRGSTYENWLFCPRATARTAQTTTARNISCTTSRGKARGRSVIHAHTIAASAHRRGGTTQWGACGRPGTEPPARRSHLTE
jgi:hypothetical protein